MSEFIITSGQFERAVIAIQGQLDRPINEVFVSGDKLPEIVRCRDCDSWSGPCEIRPGSVEGVCDGWSATGNVVLTREDDFCSYGARRDEER